MPDLLEETVKNIDTMTEILEDNTKQKHDVLMKLADTKIALHTESQRANEELTEKELRIISLENQLEDQKKTNIQLVDRIQLQNKKIVPDLVGKDDDEQAKKDERLKAKADRYQTLLRQFNKEYADEVIKMEYPE